MLQGFVQHFQDLQISQEGRGFAACPAVLLSIKVLHRRMATSLVILVLPRPTVKSIAIAWRTLKKSTQENPEWAASSPLAGKMSVP